MIALRLAAVGAVTLIACLPINLKAGGAHLKKFTYWSLWVGLALLIGGMTVWAVTA